MTSYAITPTDKTPFTELVSTVSLPLSLPAGIMLADKLGLPAYTATHKHYACWLGEVKYSHNGVSYLLPFRLATDLDDVWLSIFPAQGSLWLDVLQAIEAHAVTDQNTFRRAA